MSASTADSSRGLGQMVLGRYRVVRALASGGMGAVYLARAEGAAGFVKPVVIKRSLRAGGGLSDQLFAREARILSSLRHPSVVSIVDFAEEDGDYIMVLDYVHGYTLQQWSRFVRKTRGGMPVELAIYVTRRILEGLHYAHTLRDSNGSPLGIVHRDVKPSNVLIDVQGQVKLADFGVARTNTEVTDTTTGDATLKGTFAYMAPELFGKGTPSPASDVYSASVTLYQLLAGRNPFVTNDAVLTAARALRHEPESIGQLRDDVSPRLCNVIHKGLCKHPEGRFASAGDLAEALSDAYPETEDADAIFRAAVEADFHDPQLPVVLETDSLRQREEAWSRFGDPDELPRRIALPLSPSELENTEVQAAIERGELGPSADPASPTATSLDSGVHTADTVLLGHRQVEAPAVEDAPTPRKRSWIPIAVAVAAVGVGVAALLVSRGGADEPEQTVLMVRGDVTMDGDEPATDPDPDGEPAAPAPDPDPERVERRSSPATPRAATTADALTSRFRKRQALITRCFDRYPEQATGAGKLAVRFHVGVDGVVVRAELVPPEMASEPLGECLLEVAQGTRFGGQKEALTFRIPISVRAQ